MMVDGGSVKIVLKGEKEMKCPNCDKVVCCQKHAQFLHLTYHEPQEKKC